MKAKILTFTLLISAYIITAQSITNINPVQRTDGSMIVDISYDLAGPEPEYTITVEVSFDSGATFTEINNVTGFVGNHITPGIGKTIEWNFGDEFPNQYSANTKIKIIASNAWVCGDDLIDERDSQTYTTVQIGTQCWMAENLNIGTRIDGVNDMSDNGIIEKYCYNDNISNCDIYGGLYQWNEMMQYVTNEGAQGICPEGWHIPTDAEWCTLENEVDAGSVSCTATGYRGTDAGLNLKSIEGWGGDACNGIDLYGFRILSSGYRIYNGSFTSNYNAHFYSSSESGSNAWYRNLTCYYPSKIARNNNVNHSYGFSIRCIKD